MTEEKKTKGKGCLIALGVVGVFIIILYFSVTVFLNKAKNVVGDLAKGVGVSPEVIEEVKTLNKKYRFEPPENNIITEKQVKTFIAIKRDFADKIKQHKSELRQLEEKSEKEEYGFKELADSFKLLGDIRRDFLKALKENGMSPREYKYLSEQIYGAYFIDSYKELMQQTESGLSEMEGQVEKIPEKNIELLNKYRAELEELNTFGFEYWGLTLTAAE